jgi:hypothetical protein
MKYTRAVKEASGVDKTQQSPRRGSQNVQNSSGVPRIFFMGGSTN